MILKRNVKVWSGKPTCIVQQNNKPSHTLLTARKVLTMFNVAILLQAPYRPNLAHSLIFGQQGQERLESEAIRHYYNYLDSLDKVS